MLKPTPLFKLIHSPVYSVTCVTSHKVTLFTTLNFLVFYLMSLCFQFLYSSLCLVLFHFQIGKTACLLFWIKQTYNNFLSIIKKPPFSWGNFQTIFFYTYLDNVPGLSFLPKMCKQLSLTSADVLPEIQRFFFN